MIVQYSVSKENRNISFLPILWAFVEVSMFYFIFGLVMTQHILTLNEIALSHTEMEIWPQIFEAKNQCLLE